jgi:hypothetical protein
MFRKGNRGQDYQNRTSTTGQLGKAGSKDRTARTGQGDGTTVAGQLVQDHLGQGQSARTAWTGQSGQVSLTGQLGQDSQAGQL